MLAVFLTVALVAATGTLAANPKLVVAHFMAQNSYSYSQSDWTNDITTAQGIGIDGFGETHFVCDRTHL